MSVQNLEFFFLSLREISQHHSLCCSGNHLPSSKAIFNLSSKINNAKLWAVKTVEERKRKCLQHSPKTWESQVQVGAVIYSWDPAARDAEISPETPC